VNESRGIARVTAYSYAAKVVPNGWRRFGVPPAWRGIVPLDKDITEEFCPLGPTTD